MIKLLGIDLDGTLLYPKRRFTTVIRKNVTFLREFVKNGGKIVFVSGRSPKVVPQLEKKIGCSIPFLGCNGSYLLEDGQLKQPYPIPNEIAIQLYAKLRSKFGILSWLLLDDTDHLYMCFYNINPVVRFVVKAVNDLSFAYRENITYGEKEFIKALNDNTYYKLMPVFGLGKKGRKKALDAYTAINDLYKDSLFICNSNNALEISNIKANKATGLLEFCKSHGYKEDEVAVIGDSGNDIVLFENFKHSFAMKHAIDSVKGKAKHVVNRVYDMKDIIEKINSGEIED